ncbi:hypothetical protein N658DRAFT_506922 [Parathielavia hyrcaniae]|uniref:VPS37 C-terminal domain-containing protein n=1 Tax=Parathielavia hyrcaniae TaxID=113614 RepID=A0AAN6Q4T0_9PEZI|nr:hypothetical protein N658DRAFT_506922 [Parathielavia hyrcaniae]
MYASTPPPPPPKPPGSHDVSRMSTPASGPAPPPPPLPEAMAAGPGSALSAATAEHGAGTQSVEVEDPGEQWLPKFLEDKPYVTHMNTAHWSKVPSISDRDPPFNYFPAAAADIHIYIHTPSSRSKQDLADMLRDGGLLAALTHSPETMHGSLRASHEALRAALADNMALAAAVAEAERRLAHQRATAQARLLSNRALERQWRARQRDMDHALAPFAPASLYQRLAQGVVEQEAVCYALEESFLEDGGGGGGGRGGREGDGAGLATEREVGEWVRRYREAKKLYYLRQERKERWDEGRGGGWR